MSNSTSAVIDSMVAAQAGASNITATANSETQRSSVTVEPGENGALKVTAARIEGPSPARIEDTGGVDFAGQAASMQANIGRIQAQLDELTHDPKTGEARYVVPAGSRERNQLQMQANSARQSLNYQISRQEALAAQRAADAQATPAHDPRSLAAFLSNGNPALAKQILAELQQQEAAALAERIRNGSK